MALSLVDSTEHRKCDFVLGILCKSICKRNQRFRNANGPYNVKIVTRFYKKSDGLETFIISSLRWYCRHHRCQTTNLEFLTGTMGIKIGEYLGKRRELFIFDLYFLTANNFKVITHLFSCHFSGISRSPVSSLPSCNPST